MALTGRFGNPELPFDSNPHGNSQTLFAALRTIASQIAADRAVQFAWRLVGATAISPAQTPVDVEETIQAFPELRQAAETFPMPGGGLSVIGPTGQAAQAEAISNTGAHDPHPAELVVNVRTVRGRPRPEAQQAARGLRMHFHTVRGATEISAPSRRSSLGPGRCRPAAHGLAGQEATPAQGPNLPRQVRLHERRQVRTGAERGAGYGLGRSGSWRRGRGRTVR